MQRMTRVLAEQALRPGRPDVVVSRRKIEQESAVRCKNTLRLHPLTFRGVIVQALNRIAHADNERGFLLSKFLLDPLINASLRLPRTVSKKHEAKGIARM